jgi:uncharacterized repeat protein (TIGR01451 family)
MIFYQNGPAAGRLSTGLFGYASASRIFLDTAATITPPVRRGISTDPVSFTVEFRNDGSVEGTGATLTMTLPPSLTYLEDTAAVPPEISDQDVVWTLGDVAPWSHDSFVVSVGISSTAKLLHTYPLTVTIAVEGQESTLANNRDSAQVVIRRPLYLPSVVRPD